MKRNHRFGQTSASAALSEAMKLVKSEKKHLINIPSSPDLADLNYEIGINSNRRRSLQVLH